MVGISTTHLSHIETANTKLSLPVFVAIAEALDVRADALLYDVPAPTTTDDFQEIADIMSACTVKQAKILTSIIKAAKQSFDIYMK